MRDGFDVSGAGVRAFSISRTRWHRWPLLPLALVWLLGPGVARLRAQTYLQSIGLPPFTTQLPVENGFINAANGQLHLEIPLGSFPQRGGRQETVSLMYDSGIWWNDNSSSWQPTNVNSSPFGASAGSWSGWRPVASMHGGFTDYSSYESGWCTPEADYTYWDWGPWIYVEPNGTLHSFNVATQQQNYDQECGTEHPNASGYATDGSGYYINITSYTLATVYAPDGTLVAGGYHEDSNGNYYPVTSTSSPSWSWSALDTLGRAEFKESDNSGSGSGNTFYYDVANSDGSTSTYTVKLGTVSVNTNFGVSGVSEYSGSITVVTELDLPDGTKYQFGYDSGTTSGHYGQLTSITLPTGGTINYAYNKVTDAQGNPYNWIHTRTTPDSSTVGSEWTYAFATVGTTCSSGQVDCQQKLTVTKPPITTGGSQDTDVYTFALNGGAWPVEAQYNSGSSTLLATTTQCFSFVTVTSGSCSYSVTTASPATSVARMAITSTLPIPGSTVSATTEYTWGGTVVLPTAISEWNFGTLTSGNPDRITNISYLGGYPYNLLNISNRPSSVTVTNGSGSTTVAKTTYSYDGSSPGSATGMTNHDDTYGGTTDTIRGNVTTINRYYTTSNSLQTLIVYDMTGQVTSSKDPKLNQTSYSSSTDCYKNDNGTSSPSSTSPATTNAYITSVQTAISGISASLCYYYGTGQVASTTDANGNATHLSYYYDSTSKLTTDTTWLPNNGWTLTRSSVASSLETGADTYTGITDTTASTGCSSCRHDQTILDSLGLGRLGTQKLVSDPDYSGGTKVDTVYDSNGRAKTVSNPYRTTSDATYGLETPAYDGLDRTTSVTHADSSVVSTAYGDQVGSGVSQSCTPTSTYGHGFPILTTDEAGKKRQTWTDAFGRVIETDEPDASGNLTVYTCYTYDLNNNLTGVTAAGGTQTRSYSYDLLSRLTEISDPESGTTYFCYGTGTSCNGTSSTTLCSGDQNAVCLRTDAKSITTTYAYVDGLSRLTGVSYSDGTTPSVTYSYDSTSCLSLSVTCYNVGHRTGMTDGSGSTSWAYDAVGNILRESKTIAGKTNVITYTYNPDSSPATVVYPSGRTVTYTTGNAERRTAASDSADMITYATTGQYAPQGALSSVTSGSGNILSSLSYNNRLQLCRIAVNTSGTPPTSCSNSNTGNLMDLGFTYPSGNNGNIATEPNNVSGASGRTQNYTYDPLNRILSAYTNATSGGDCWGQLFGNNATPPTLGDDALGNLLAISTKQCSPPNLSVSVNVHNQINSPSGFVYDSSGNGNMTNDGTGANTYGFDAENRVNSATNSSGTVYCYVYDGDGLRVAKGNSQAGYSCTNTSHAPTMYELYWRNTAGDTIAETDGSGSTSTTNAAYNEYVFFDGQRIAQSNPHAGTVNFYFADQLGSTRMVTNSSGSPCYEADFLPYGTENTPASFTNTCSTTYKFTGYERDPETAYGVSNGNDYAFARYYNPRLGRFLSPDPLFTGDITDPQTLNRYAYVRNNPLRWTDPTGLCDNDPTVLGESAYDSSDYTDQGECPGDQSLPPPDFEPGQGPPSNVLPVSPTIYVTATGYYDNYFDFVGPVPSKPQEMSQLGQDFLQLMSARMAPLNKLSDCAGQAVASNIPLADKLGMTSGDNKKTPVSKVDSTLGKADSALGTAGNVGDVAKNSETIARDLFLIELPNIAELVAKYGPRLGAILDKLGPYGAAATVLNGAMQTASCYNKGGG